MCVGLVFETHSPGSNTEHCVGVCITDRCEINDGQTDEFPAGEFQRGLLLAVGHVLAFVNAHHLRRESGLVSGRPKFLVVHAEESKCSLVVLLVAAVIEPHWGTFARNGDLLGSFLVQVSQVGELRLAGFVFNLKNRMDANVKVIDTHQGIIRNQVHESYSFKEITRKNT